MSRRTLSNGFRVVFSLGLLALLLRQVGVGQVVTTLKKAAPAPLVVALGLYLVGVVLRAYRWQGLLSALGMAASLARLTVLYFVGTFFNNLLPTGVGGDVVRAYKLALWNRDSTGLARDGPGAAIAASSVLVDRASGLLVLLAMAVGALAFGYRLVTPALAVLILSVALGSFASVGLLLQAGWWRRLRDRWPWLRSLAEREGIRAFYQSFSAYGRPALGRAFAISFAFNILLIAVNILLAWSLGVRVSPWYFVLFVPLISFSLMLPISLSGLGVREGAYVFLFAQAGVPAPLALAMSLLFYAVTVATGLIGGVLYALEGIIGSEQML
ncbi:MAG: YbhN family protein [Anaerolineae bacterium]